MFSASGIISDRLRKMFSSDDKVWTPQRPPEAKKMPKKGVQGIPLQGRKKK